jgi:hypothetical protein
MKKELRALFVTAMLCAPVFGLPNYAAARPRDEKKQHEPKGIAKEVRHQLVMLPWYSVFDNLAYSVEGDKVTLYGQVTRPSLKSDAEGAVKSVEGVISFAAHCTALSMGREASRGIPFRPFLPSISSSRMATSLWKAL